MTSIPVDLDGDGQQETLVGNGSVTEVIKNGHVVWQHNGPIDGWNRSNDDTFTPADIDGDHKQEVVVADNKDHWTGVFKWDGHNLHTIWGSPTPLDGPAGGWNRGWDILVPCDVDGDGHVEVLIANNTDKWTGLLKWQGGGLEPIWMSPSPLHGPAGSFVRSGSDTFTESGGTVLGISGPQEHCILQWASGALVPIQITQNAPPLGVVSILLDRDPGGGPTWSSVNEAGGEQTKPIVYLSLSVPSVWNANQATVTHENTSTVMAAPGTTAAFDGEAPAGHWTVTLPPNPHLTNDPCSLTAMTKN